MRKTASKEVFNVHYNMYALGKRINIVVSDDLPLDNNDFYSQHNRLTTATKTFIDW